MAGDLRLNIVLKAIDTATKPVRAVAASISGLTKATKSNIQPTQALSRAMDDLEAASRPVDREVNEAARAIDHVAGQSIRALGPLGRLKERLDAVSRTRAGAVLRTLGGAVGSLARGGAFAIGTAIGLGISAALAGLMTLPQRALQEGALRDGYLNLLTTLNRGDTSAARRDMAWVTQFATETPEQLNDVMKAFVMLRSQGLNPMDGTLRSLGNAAAVFAPMGKSLDDVTNALTDAAMGEFERLKEFGIKAEQRGDRVILTYGTMRIETEKNAAAITAAIRSIFDANFAGAMQRQVDTIPGLLSMISDHWSNFKAMIADAGLSDFVKTELQTFLNWLNEAAASGKLQQWAKEISAALIKMLTAIKDIASAIDWVALIRHLADLASAIASVVKATNGFEDLRMQINPLGTLWDKWDQRQRAVDEEERRRAQRDGAVNAPGRGGVPAPVPRPQAPTPSRPPISTPMGLGGPLWRTPGPGALPPPAPPSPPPPPQRIELRVRADQGSIVDVVEAALDRDRFDLTGDVLRGGGLLA